MDSQYAKALCPITPDACGQTNYTFSSSGNSQTVTSTGLAVGDTCWYKIEAACGAPYFTITNANNVQVDYITS
jgi:hypothetical protein